MLLALLFALLFGVVVGTLLRQRLERPVRYLGSVPATLPLDVGYAGAMVLDPGHCKEQVG